MFIELGEIKINLLILLIYPVGIISARISANYYSNNPYFYLFLFFLSHYFALIIKLIYIIKERFSTKDSVAKEDLFEEENSSEELKRKRLLEINNELNKIKWEIDKRAKINKIIRIIFIGILYFITYVFFYYYNFIVDTKFYGNISMIS